MAPRYPPEAQATPLPEPILLDRLVGIFAAGREEAAAATVSEKRKQTMVKRQGFLIKTDEF